MTDKTTPESAELSFADKMSYTDYLGLDQILSAQNPRSTAHDEMLFIIQHQVSELWLRLAIYELDAARDLIAKNQVRPAFKMLSRVARIFEQLNNAWDVLRTMTPSEYTEFRSDLGQSSGFQSHQYRLVEYIVGNRNHTLLKPHAHPSGGFGSRHQPKTGTKPRNRSNLETNLQRTANILAGL
jgi:tryptophan 2,3-dioxygenase